MANAKFYAALPKFIEKFFYGSTVRLAQQRWFDKPCRYDGAMKGKTGFSYVSFTRPASELPKILLEHFYLAPIKSHDGTYRTGSYSVCPLFEDTIIKNVVVDLDKIELVNKAKSHLLPKLLEYGFDPRLEHSGGVDGEYTRGHLWIPVFGKAGTVQQVFKQLFHEADCKIGPEEFDEVFGVRQLSNAIRIFGGAHAKKGLFTRYPVEINDEFVTDPVALIEDYLTLHQPDEEELLKKIKADFKIDEPVKVRGIKKTFYYEPQNLDLPIEVPNLVKPCFTECKAINSILKDTVSKQMIYAPGDQHHYANLWLGRLAKYNDVKLTRKFRTKISGGERWFDKVQEEYRIRDGQDHFLKASWPKMDDNPERYFPSCKVWDEKFQRCEGCPVRGMIQSPKWFIHGIPLTKTKVGEVKLITPDECRKTTLKEFKEYTYNAVLNGEKKDILVCTFQGSGKSHSIIELTQELAEKGKRVLIASPLIDISLEQVERLEAKGIKSFGLYSHKSIFEKKISNKVPICPKFKEIQDSVQLGASSSEYKATFCKGCPFYNDCYYPNQYSQVMEDEYQVVIIQHTHLQCQETIIKLLQKGFDVLFVDETFIDICYSSIVPKPKEIEVLESFELKWCKVLSEWLSSKRQSGPEFAPTEKTLDKVKKAFDKEGLSWTVPDYIRYYNQRRRVHETTGVEVIYELPYVPVRVLLDATPPVRLIKNLTGIDDLTMFGEDEVLDLQSMNPDNHVIQLLDSSAAVGQMMKPGGEGTEKFEALLMKAAEIVEMSLTGKKVLFTIYKSQREYIENFFLEHALEFPTARKFITLDHMKKGINDYANFDAQFIFCGRYFTGNQYEISTYVYKSVTNFMNHKIGRKQISNLFPYSALEDKLKSYGRIKVPTRRVDWNGDIIEFNIDQDIPDDPWFYDVYEYLVGDTQQAIRVRANEKPILIYILHSLYLPKIPVRHHVLYENFIRELPSPRDLW